MSTLKELSTRKDLLMPSVRMMAGKSYRDADLQIDIDRQTLTLKSIKVGDVTLKSLRKTDLTNGTPEELGNKMREHFYKEDDNEPR